MAVVLAGAHTGCDKADEGERIATRPYIQLHGLKEGELIELLKLA